jgi:hypothetical protein
MNINVEVEQEVLIKNYWFKTLILSARIFGYGFFCLLRIIQEVCYY